MECDNCHGPVNLSEREFLERKDQLGTVICYACMNGVEGSVHEAESQAY